MVDFTLSEKDQEVINELRKQSVVRRKYARYYDEHEEEIAPNEFPEAKDFEHINMMAFDRGEEGCSPTVFYLLQQIEHWRGDLLHLRRPAMGLGNASVMAAGTEEQKEKWSTAFLAMANTEPGCGSDSKAIETTATLDGDEWVLNGEKIFVTKGISGDGAVVWATLDKSAGRGAIKSFVVMNGTPGFNLVKKEKKLGIRASDTAAYVLKDCRIPRENLLGLDEKIKTGGGGFKGLMQTFNITRPITAAMGIGNTLACLEFVTEELEKEEVKVDWDIGQHKRNAIEQKLIDFQAELEAATLTTLRAGWLADKGKPNNLESSVSKVKGGEVSRTGPRLALEIIGAMGISEDHLVEKWYRDARITDIYEGTGEIQRLVIARGILGYSAKDLK